MMELWYTYTTHQFQNEKTDHNFYYLYSIYRSPSNNVELFIDELKIFVLAKAISLKADYKIIIGDMKLNLLHATKTNTKYLRIF